MAITTLPYPNMDFVPLDVLTADELDQIVANIEAINNATIGTGAIANSAITTAKIANSAISTAKIADKAITSSKMDWTTFGSVMEQYTSTGTKTLNISSIPTGAKFAVLIAGYVQITGANFSIRSGYNGTSGPFSWYNKPSGTGGFSGSMANINWYVKVAGADTLEAVIGTQSAVEANFGVIVFRVG